jgi:hypothetical protein
MSSTLPQTVFNYLVPASGNTHVVKFTGLMTALAPVTFDCESYSLANNFTFIPQGITVQNNSANPMTVTVNPIGYVETVPAQSQQSLQIPAIKNGSISFSGTGAFTAYLTDYPLLPQSGSVVLTNSSLDVSIVGSSAPIQVTLPNKPSNGSGYLIAPQFAALTVASGSLSAGATSANFSSTTNNTPYKLVLFISSNAYNATLAAPTVETITFTCNGFSYDFYYTMPNAISTNPDREIIIDLGYATFGLAGSGNNAYTLASSVAVANGQISATVFEAAPV